MMLFSIFYFLFCFWCLVSLNTDSTLILSFYVKITVTYLSYWWMTWIYLASISWFWILVFSYRICFNSLFVTKFSRSPFVVVRLSEGPIRASNSKFDYFISIVALWTSLRILVFRSLFINLSIVEWSSNSFLIFLIYLSITLL